MARKVVITLVDDYDGTSTADETVVFGLDGIDYEIDLSTAHAQALRNALAQWISHARRTGRSKPGPGARVKPAAPASDRRSELAAIRAWATAKGFEVSSRGRVPAEILATYRAGVERSGRHASGRGSADRLDERDECPHRVRLYRVVGVGS